MKNLFANRRFWWKELRQLVPLVILLLVLVPILIGIDLMTTAFRFTSMSAPSMSIFSVIVYILGLPCLFAVGIGSVLVGQEKEQRTIQWLSHLPIKPVEIVTQKLNSGLLLLGLLWLVCIPLAWLMVVGQTTNPLGLEKILFGVAFSLFLLTWSLAISWRIHGVLSALLTLVPVAVLPFIAFAYVENWVTSSVGKNDILVDRINIGILTALALVGYGLVYRFGTRALAAEPAVISPKGSDPLEARQELSTFRVLAGEGLPPLGTGDSLANYRKLLNPIPALIWQTFRQSQLLWLGLAIMFLVAIVVSVAFPRPYVTGWVSPEAYFLTHLAACWLGVLAFVGDSSQNRIRFLADRGISPRRVWLTRHVPAAQLMIAYLLLLAIALPLAPGVSLNVLDIFLAVATSAVHIFAVYAISQWIGQLFRTPAIAVIAATIGSWIFVLFCLSFLTFFGTPWWVIGAICLLPLAITGYCQSAWMDSRYNFRYWMVQGLTLLAIVLVPIIPGLWQVYRTPTIDARVEEEITLFAQMSGGAKYQRNIIIPLLADTTKTRFYGAAAAADLAAEPTSVSGVTPSLQEQQKRQIEAIAKQLESDVEAIDLPNSSAARFLVGYVRLIHRGWQNQMPDEESLEQYRLGLRLLSQFVIGGRRSNRLLDQEIADRLELVLLEELEQSNAIEILGSTLFREIAEPLGDQHARLEARKRALAVSYLISMQSAMDLNLGGFWNPSVGPFSWVNRSIEKRQFGRAAQDLWELLHEPAAIDHQDRMARIAEFFGAIDGSPLASDRDDQSLTRLLVLANFSRAQSSRISVPGLLWHGQWEQQATELLDRLPPINQEFPEDDD